MSMWHEEDLRVKTHSYQAGDQAELTIDEVVFGGEGLARLEGLVVFVPGVAEGERVRVEITQVKKDFLRAELIEILISSPHRIVPRCSIYGRSGGCQYQHIDYDAQLRIKESQIRDVLERIGRFKNVLMKPIIRSPLPWAYRTRVDFHVRLKDNEIKVGFVENDGRTVVEVGECPISTAGINQSLQSLRESLQKGLSEMPNWVRNLKFWDSRDGVQYILMNSRGDIDLRGIEFVRLSVSDMEFKVPPLSFFQVNIGMIESMVKCMDEFFCFSGKEFLLDAYCGVGLFTLLLAKKVRRSMGIESDTQAIEFAKRNARENGLINCEFLAKSVEKISKHPEKYLDEKPDCVILDPTRAGCERVVLDALLDMGPEKIAYVSCHPPTLARDLEILCQEGYHLSQVQPMDLFPQTKHCEVIACLEKNSMLISKVLCS